jgi:DNA polymerase III epsilon subunit-like protein
MTTQPKTHIRVLVLDTETTGKLPKHRKGTPFPPSEAYPYITQISWIIYNVERDFVEETFDTYINVPQEIPITEEITQITGVTRELLDKKGQPMVPVLLALYRAYMKCQCIVAHNMSFDAQVIRQEIYRSKDAIYQRVGLELTSQVRGLFSKAFNELHEIEMVCTMMSSIELCGIEFPPTALQVLAKTALQNAGVEIPPPAKPTQKKFPTLKELYTKLFEQPLPENMHNSIVDVLVCLRCFLKLRGYQELSDRKMNLILYHNMPVSK